MTDTDNGASPSSNTQVLATAAVSATEPVSQFGAPFPVHISFPKLVEIKMVDASTLNDYEIVLFFASGFFSAFIGFGVAWFQATISAGLYLAITLVFGAASAGFFIWALAKRKKLHSESTTFRLRPTA